MELINNYLINNYIKKFKIGKIIYHDKNKNTRYFIEKYNNIIYFNDTTVAKILNIDINRYIELASKYTNDINKCNNKKYIYFNSKEDIESFIKDLYKEKLRLNYIKHRK